MGVYGKLVLEAKSDPSFKEIYFGKWGNKISLNMKDKTFIIKNINFDKFILRLKEMYKYRGIANLFERKYSALSMILYKKKLIRKANLKTTQLEVHLFFALELYKIFMELGEFYKLPYYIQVAKDIYKKTWISNVDKIKAEYTNVKNLDKFNYTLTDYQMEFIRNYNMLKETNELEGYILAFKQGLGKTFTSIALAECLNKNQVIIVCQNTLKENWAYELRNYYKIYQDRNKWIKDIFILNNSKFTNKKNPKFIIVNQESIDKIYNIIDKEKNSMIIVDESQNFRNLNSDRTEKLLKLKELLGCKDNLMMSGTPIKAMSSEIAPALRMIDPYFTDELARIYVKTFSNNTPEIANVVKERLNRVIYVKNKDVLNLPEKTINEIKLKIQDPKPYFIKTVKEEVGKEFKTVYEEKLKEIPSLQERFTKIVLKYSSASIQETMKYLQYIDPLNGNSKSDIHELDQEFFDTFLNKYVYPNIENPAIKKELEYLVTKYVYLYKSAMGIAIGRVYPKARENCYIELFNQNIDYFIEAIKNNTKKTIIFTQFLKVVKFVDDKLYEKGIGCVKITGETKNRMDIINDFKQDDDLDVLVATTQTLSTGVTIVEANQMFFLGTPDRESDFEQACDRIHRIGQNVPVTINVILLDSQEKNITDRMNDILKWSGNLSDAVLT